MALIDCSGCGRRISDRAVACPKCGKANNNFAGNAKESQIIDEAKNNIQEVLIENKEHDEQINKSKARSIILFSARLLYVTFTLLAVLLFSFLVIIIPELEGSEDMIIFIVALIINIILSLPVVYLFKYALKASMSKKIDYFLLGFSTFIAIATLIGLVITVYL